LLEISWLVSSQGWVSSKSRSSKTALQKTATHNHHSKRLGFLSPAG
jgi:hypothetical protein